MKFVINQYQPRPLLPSTQVQTSSSAPYFRTRLAHVPPLIWQAKFHTHTKLQTTLHSSVHSNLYFLTQQTERILAGAATGIHRIESALNFFTRAILRLNSPYWNFPNLAHFKRYRVRQKNLTIFKLQQNEQYVVLLREFITKIIFISKHFNRNIHFLNTVSVRWRPLLPAHSPKRRTSDKSLTHSFDVRRSSKWRLSSRRFPFYGRRCFSAVSHPQQYSIATRDTVVSMNIEVPTKYPVSHNARIIVLEIHLHSQSPMLYRPALHGNWNALSLARRALKDKFPTPMVPLIAVLSNRQVFLPDPVHWLSLSSDFVLLLSKQVCS